MKKFFEYARTHFWSGVLIGALLVGIGFLAGCMLPVALGINLLVQFAMSLVGGYLIGNSLFKTYKTK